MNALDLWIHSAAAKALGTALAHFVWEGAGIAALLAISLAVFRGSARARYGLACAALVAMPIAFGVTLAMLWPHSAEGLKVPLPPLDLARVAMPLGSGGAPAPWTFANILPWAAPIWMVGVAVFLVYRFASWIAAQRLRRLGACAAPAEWSRRVGELATRLKISRHVELLESCLAEVPMLIGYLRPVILVPIGMLTALPVDQIEAILLHELAHIRRADYLVNLLQTAIESVLFYHPAVWWISSVVRAERENCCDDFVIAGNTDPRTYAAALIALEQGRGSDFAIAANGGNLVRRVRRVLRTPAPRESNLVMGPVALAILGAGIAFAAWQPKVEKETPVVKSSAPPVANIPSRYKLVLDGPHPIDGPPPIDGPHAIAQVLSTPQRKQAEPQFESKYFVWLNSEVVYIITDDEKKAFRALTTDEEREKFIEQFWARRDPTPDTPRNEFREEHYRRIAYANERFAVVGGRRGGDTDRGRIYIMYGPPNEIESHPAGNYQRPAEQGGGTTSTYPFEKWQYRWIEGIGQNVILEFVDQAGKGEYRMTLGPADKEVRAALAQLPQSLPDAVSGPAFQAVHGVPYKESDQIREALRMMRTRYSEEHPEVQVMIGRLNQALYDEARTPGVGFRGKHAGVVIYAEGRVSLVVPLEGPGPFAIYARIDTADGLQVSYFEESVPTAALLNFTREIALKPGSYVFKVTLNGAHEIVRFEVK
jgi:GWxTD domain-containing protein